jgi:RNA-binding protein YhbY
MSNKKSLDDILKELNKELETKREICKIRGHQNAIYNIYIPNIKSTPDDKLRGMCEYCLTNLERQLNEQELIILNNFYETQKKKK